MEIKISKENIGTRSIDKTIKELVNDIEKGLKLQEIPLNNLTDEEKLSYVDSIIVNPDYQREYRYNRRDESSIIESILVGIPIPPIFIAKSAMNKIHIVNVIDGQHRLKAIYRFLKNDYALENLKLLNESYDGKFYDNLEMDEKMLLLSKKINFIEFEKFPGLEIEIEIFNRYNKGTKPLTSQEIRHAVYNSKFNEYVNEFSKSLAKDPKNPLHSIYNITTDRIQKKKIQESIFVILAILENGINVKLDKSPDYAEKFMEEKKKLAENEIEFEMNFKELEERFEKFNNFIIEVGKHISHPFSKEIYGIASRNYKFQISTAMILSAIYHKMDKEEIFLDNVDISNFLEEIKNKLSNSYLENPEYSASSTNPKEMQKLLETIDVVNFKNKLSI